MVFDFHLHVFPDALAPKVIPMLAKRSNLFPVTDGTVSDTVAKMKEWGIDGGLFLNIATVPRQQTTINNTAAQLNGKDGFYAFGSVHPYAENVEDELRRIKALGLCGIKLHPEYQEFFADDKNVFHVYELCSSLGLAVVFHAGADIGCPPPVHASADRLSAVADNFPELRIVAAHFGGFMHWDTVDYYLIGKKNVWFDTSMTAGWLSPERMKAMALRHGTDRILFGSDCPWCSGKTSLRQILDMGLSVEDTERILYKNAMAFFNDLK